MSNREISLLLGIESVEFSAFCSESVCSCFIPGSSVVSACCSNSPRASPNVLSVVLDCLRKKVKRFLASRSFASRDFRLF